MWNPTRPDSLAPPDGGAAADFVDPDAALPAAAAVGGPDKRLVVGVGVVLALAWVLIWYRSTAWAMVDIWSRSGTFAHGYLIAPISIWLAWRKRDLLRTLPLAPSMLGLLAGLMSGIVWLTAELARVDALAQFALVGMLISVVWAVAGTAVAKALAFPLGFLFFSVPFGEFLFPTMMEATARFTVSAVRLSGVPVYTEGLSLIIPTGHWQIVEECSGVRYLIASVVVGSLYAYLNYRSLVRRFAFVSIAVVVPILANWLRAYGIVMLGHLSNNRLATGLDHIVYGWVFFGVVVLGLFWIGARWSESPVAKPDRPRAAVASLSAPGLGSWSAMLVLALAVFPLWTGVLQWLEARGAPAAALVLPVPTPAAGWAPADDTELPAWTPDYHGMTAEARTVWKRDDAAVGLYVGYYRDQTPSRELINSENKILRSKHPGWTLTGSGDRLAPLPSGEVPVQVTEMLGASGRLRVWHWYWIGGRVTSNAYIAKALTALTKLTQRKDDSAVVVVFTTVTESGRAEAEARLEAFTRDMGPAINQGLAAASGATGR